MEGLDGISTMVRLSMAIRAKRFGIFDTVITAVSQSYFVMHLQVRRVI